MTISLSRIPELRWPSPSFRAIEGPTGGALEPDLAFRKVASERERLHLRTSILQHEDAPGQQYEMILAAPSAALEAGALAYMASGPYDVRPHLLLAKYAQDLKAIRACVSYGQRYVTAWAARRGLAPHAQVISAAAADAFARFYDGRDIKGKQLTVAARARVLGVRKSNYAQLRSLCLDVYRNRYLEALEAFGRQMAGPDSTQESPQSKAGRRDRSPAHDPGAPPRLVGRQQIKVHRRVRRTSGTDWAA